MLKLTKIMTNLRKSFSEKLIFSILIFTVVVFINSCDKKQELVPENQQIHTPIEEREQTDLKDIKNVEQKVKEVVGCGGGGISTDNPTIFEETFGLRNDVRVIYYSNEGTRTFVFPLLKNDKIANLLLVSEDDNYYILEKTERLANEDVIDTKISPYTARIFDADNYLSRDIQLSNIRSSLGTDYKIDKEGNVLILKEKTANSGRLSRTSTGKLAAACSPSVMSSMTSQYLILLGFDNTYFDIVYEAVVNSQPDGACWCPNPTLILEYLGLAGQDWFYDDNYWATNPTFPTQVLPTYTNFYNAFPKNPQDGSWLYGPEIYNTVGGDVLQVRLDFPGDTENTCALKVSVALNGAGIIIPDIASTTTLPGTVSGADGKYYFLNARALSEWMKRTFTTFSSYTPAQYNNTDGVHTLLNGRRGIIISEYGAGSSGSGHSDIYTGTTCSNSPNNPSAACSIGGTVRFWELN